MTNLHINLYSKVFAYSKTIFKEPFLLSYNVANPFETFIVCIKRSNYRVFSEDGLINVLLFFLILSHLYTNFKFQTDLLFEKMFLRSVIYEVLKFCFYNTDFIGIFILESFLPHFRRLKYKQAISCSFSFKTFSVFNATWIIYGCLLCHISLQQTK